MGATWLHGLEGNPLYAYAVEHGLMSSAAKQKGAWLLDMRRCLLQAIAGCCVATHAQHFDS